MAHRRRDRLTTSRSGTSRTRTCQGHETPPEPPSAKARLFYRQVRHTIVAALPGHGEGGTRTHAPLIGGGRFSGPLGTPAAVLTTVSGLTKNPLSSDDSGLEFLGSQIRKDLS